jgi:hypothetical protein
MKKSKGGPQKNYILKVVFVTKMRDIEACFSLFATCLGEAKEWNGIDF